MMKMITAACVCAVLAGCGGDSGDIQDQVNLLKARVDSLDEERAKTAAELSRLRTIVDSHGGELFGLKLNDVAILTTDAEGYSVVRADIGTLALKITDVKPYADGSKITVQIGNTTAAQISGLKGKVDWSGSKFGADALDMKKEVTFGKDLPSGGWASETFVIPRTKPEEITTIVFSEMRHRAISLRR